MAYRQIRPTVFVTRHRPLAILELNEWLRTSVYRDDFLLFTRLGWQSSYVSLYWPAMIGRALTVSNYTSDEEIRKFIRAKPPSLRITRPGDIALRERVEALLKAHGQFNQLLDGEGFVATVERPGSERPRDPGRTGEPEAPCHRSHATG